MTTPQSLTEEQKAAQRLSPDVLGDGQTGTDSGLEGVPTAAPASEELPSSEDPRMAVTNFRREIRFQKDARLVFLLHGDLGTISFIMATGWEMGEGKYGRTVMTRHADLYPTGHGVDYHSRQKTEYGYHNKECLWLDDHECWSDGSGLVADDLMEKLVTDGEDAVWPEMEGFYKSWLADEFATRAIGQKESTTTPGAEGDNKPNTPPTPTPKVEDSVVEVGE